VSFQLCWELLAWKLWYGSFGRNRLVSLLGLISFQKFDVRSCVGWTWIIISAKEAQHVLNFIHLEAAGGRSSYLRERVCLHAGIAIFGLHLVDSINKIF
jgi:hypothetical protein